MFKNVVLYLAIAIVFGSEIKMENSSKKIAFRMTTGVIVAITIIVAVLAAGITLPRLGSETGRLNVLLTDAPVELEELNITITGVEVHKSGEKGESGAWLVLVEDVEITFNLLDYQNGATLNLTSMEIPSGNYTKIRLFVSEANASYADAPDTIVELTVPPGKIDVITKFELVDQGTRTVIIDMEPDWIAIIKNNSLRPILKATISEQMVPVADFTYDPEDPIIDQTIFFNASISTDSDGTIVTYNWNFGDGTIDSGVTVDHSYSEGKTYTVTLEVIDNDGFPGTKEQDITISSPPT